MDPTELDAYVARLRSWNASPKYRAELRLLRRLLDPTPRDRILDVGCGVGTAVEYLAARSRAAIDGFDVHRLVDGSPAWYRDTLDGRGHYDKIYLLHSLAHIGDPEGLLADLVDRHLAADGRIVVITPNADYVRYMQSIPRADAYVPDPTVIRHYTLSELIALFDRAGLDVTFAGYAGPREGGHHERLFAVALPARDNASDAWLRTFPEETSER